MEVKATPRSIAAFPPRARLATAGAGQKPLAVPAGMAAQVAESGQRPARPPPPGLVGVVLHAIRRRHPEPVGNTRAGDDGAVVVDGDGFYRSGSDVEPDGHRA